MQTQSVDSSPPELQTKNNLLLLFGSVAISLLFGALIGYFSYPVVNKSFADARTNIEPQNNSAPLNDVVQSPSPITVANQIDQSGEEPPFCREYGTGEIPKKELLEEYTTGPGDTLRSIAKKQLGDETEAMNLVNDNPQLRFYEVDDELQMNMTIYVPNEKYNKPGITTYIRAKGNIVYNEEKPMFGVNAPNSGTGPFLINDEIKDELEAVKQGECVEVIYGSRQLDAQKVVFEVVLQN